MERWRGEGVVGSDGGGTGGVVESDGGERKEWEGWGLMEGEGVLLGRRCPCVHSSSMCALVVHVRARHPVQGRSLCMGGVSSLSKGGGSSSVPWVGVIWSLCVGGGVVWSSFLGVGRWSWVLGRCWWRGVVDWRQWGSFAWAGCSSVLVCGSWVRW